MLRLSLIVLIGLVTSIPGRDKDVSPDPPPNREAELRRFAGTYIVLSYEQDGVKRPDADLRRMKIVLQKDGNATFEFLGTTYTSKATPSPEKSPREVDTVHTNGPWLGKIVKGIYKMEGDKMTCCYADPGKDRPREFKAPPGSGLTLYVIQRVKE